MTDLRQLARPDAPKFKDFILLLVFYKRLSDVFDDDLARHGINSEEVREVIALDAWVPLANDAYLDQTRVIGPTYADRMLTVVLEMTDRPGVWRPITGWDSSPEELAYYREENE